MPTTHTGTVEIQHEAISNFVNASNEQVGMVAMTMPFNITPEIPLEEFKAGDAVSFVFEVRWNSEPQLRIRQMSKLPADTALQLAR